MSRRFQHRAWPLLWRAALVTLPLFLFVVTAASLLNPSPARAQAPTSLGVDVVPDGNTATSLGSIQGCVEVQVGGLFAADVYIRDVQGLRAWELYFGFNPAVLEVTHHDNRLFLPFASFDISDPVPDIDGQHFLAVATLGSSSSGSGVLAHLTLRAKAPGRSPASILFLDVNGDGQLDIGPRLSGAHPLGDGDGDGIFDGPVSQAEVAVGQPCSSPGPEPTATPAPTSTSTPTPAPTPGATPGGTPQPGGTPLRGDASSSTGSGGNRDLDLPPTSALLSDSPPRGISVLDTSRGPGRSSQAAAARDDADGEDDPPANSTDPRTPELPLRQVGEPPAGLTDGGPPTGTSASQPHGGDSPSFPFWLLGSIAGIFVLAATGGAAIVRSLRQPWGG